MRSGGDAALRRPLGRDGAGGRDDAFPARDEPGAGLDLGGREDLVERMRILALDPSAPTQVVVTHHVEEIPEGFTHALLMREGRVVTAGPLVAVLTDVVLTQTFGMPITVRHDGGRWQARRAGA